MTPHTRPAPRDTPAKVLIVDDHPAVREALRLWISRQADLQICGEAADSPEALQLVDSTDPDVAVIDLLLKAESGLELIKRIRSHHHRVAIVVWSMLDEATYAERVLRAGAQGFVNKEQASTQIITAIYRVLEGKYFLSEPTADRLLQRAMHTRDHADGPQVIPAEKLSDRELETFQWIGRGLSTTEIAEKMHVSTKTIETYRARIKDKLCIATHNELVCRAVEWVLQRL